MVRVRVPIHWEDDSSHQSSTQCPHITVFQQDFSQCWSRPDVCGLSWLARASRVPGHTTRWISPSCLRYQVAKGHFALLEISGACAEIFRSSRPCCGVASLGLRSAVRAHQAVSAAVVLVLAAGAPSVLRPNRTNRAEAIPQSWSGALNWNTRIGVPPHSKHLRGQHLGGITGHRRAPGRTSECTYSAIYHGSTTNTRRDASSYECISQCLPSSLQRNWEVSTQSCSEEGSIAVKESHIFKRGGFIYTRRRCGGLQLCVSRLLRRSARMVL